MKALTIKQILDKAVRGVIEQGDLSKSGNGSCYYRHPSRPLACGVGHLIADDHYNSKCETAAVVHIEDAYRPSASFRDVALAISLHLSGVDFDRHGVSDVLDEIQSTHDNAESVREFALGMVDLYEDRKLTVPKWLSEAARPELVEA
jgi:hypothetical protein